MDKKDEHQVEAKEILAGAMTLFGELFILDLESGVYRIYKMDNVMSQVVTSTDFHEFNTNYGRALIHPEDQNKFFNAFKLDNLRKHVADGERIISVDVRRKTEDGVYHWCELSAKRFDDSSGFPNKMVMTFRDIDELRSARQEERFANQRFVSAVNNAYDAIYECELYSYKIHVWKDPGAKIRGFSSDESMEIQLERVLDTAVHPDYQEEVGRLLDRIFVEQEIKSGKTKLYYEAPCKGEDGRYRWFSLQVQLLEITDTAIHVMYYVKDIDDVKKREKRKHDELQQALAIARKANDAKMEFLSRMSHDIRTPINAIVGMTAVVGENAHDPGTVGECLKKIDVSAKFLLSLIDDILDMSKIEGGKVSIVKREFDFGKLINDLSTLCLNLMEDKQQKFEIHIGGEVKRYYIGDSLRINQVFLNLISNAFKFTPDGGTIGFSVDGDKTEDGKQWLTVVVSDNGIGMSEEFIGRVFEPFEQEHVERGKVSDSSGLGLTLCMSLIVMMGGTISASSKVGEGSAFTVRFPLEIITGMEETILEDKAGADNGRSHGVKYNFNHERILLVEDDELNREIARALLRIQSFEVDTAADGLEAIEMFEQSEPDTYKAILMDIRMPEMDGLEAARTIRSMFRADALTVPIIAMTADAYQDEQEDAREAGINDYLTKPVDAEELYRHLKRLLRPGI